MFDKKNAIVFLIIAQIIDCGRHTETTTDDYSFKAKNVYAWPDINRALQLQDRGRLEISKLE